MQIINTTFPALVPILQGVLANPAAGAAVGLSPAHYVKLVFKIFWSATFMGIPDALLTDSQFSGWMGGIHEVLRRTLPLVSQHSLLGRFGAAFIPVCVAEDIETGRHSPVLLVLVLCS